MLGFSFQAENELVSLTHVVYSFTAPAADRHCQISWVQTAFPPRFLAAATPSEPLHWRSLHANSAARQSIATWSACDKNPMAGSVALESGVGWMMEAWKSSRSCHRPVPCLRNHGQAHEKLAETIATNALRPIFSPATHTESAHVIILRNFEKPTSFL